MKLGLKLNEHLHNAEKPFTQQKYLCIQCVICPLIYLELYTVL